METEVVAIEREDFSEKKVYGSSGLMLNNKYVLCTANILLSAFKDEFFENLQLLTTGKLHSASHIKNLPELKIISSNECNKFEVKNGQILAFFICEDLKSIIQEALQGWSIDSIENSKSLEIILSLFIVIKIVSGGNISEFKNLLIQWWDVIKDEKIVQSDEIFIKSVPFGNKIFLNSLNKGIVSNVVGKNSSLIISDCPSTPGSEGSPVYKTKCEKNLPVGVLISSSCWWRQEWTGLTLIADIRSLLLEILENQHLKIKLKNIPHHLIASGELSVLHVYCGLRMGTAVIIDVKNGILLTNSHVISKDGKIVIYWREQRSSATLIYKTPDDEIFDLAVLKCSVSFLKNCNLRSVKMSKHSVKTGDEVICVGFAIFSKNLTANPTISKGHVIRCTESMMITTCCINSGMSGGAVLNLKGELVGIIVCNVKIEKTVYPRFSMAIPYTVVEKTVELFLKNNDTTHLEKLFTNDPRYTFEWRNLEAKL